MLELQESIGGSTMLDAYKIDINVDKLLPTNDILFQIIFGNPKHSHLLIHLLNAITQFESPIVSVDIAQTELTKDLIIQNGVRLNAIAKTSDNEILSIEIHNGKELNIAGRALCYWSKLFSGQFDINDPCKSLRRTMFINISDKKPYDKDGRFLRKGFITDSVTNERLTDLLEMHFVEIENILQADKNSPLAFWGEFFKNPYSEKMHSICVLVPEIKEAKNIFEKAKLDPEIRELILLKEKVTSDFAFAVADAKEEGKAEGRAQGRAEGERIGEARGIEKGKAEGKAEGERQAKVRVAQKMLLAKSYTLGDIAELTGLFISEVEALQ